MNAFPESAPVQQFWARDAQWFCRWGAGSGRTSDIGAVHRMVIAEAVPV